MKRSGFKRPQRERAPLVACRLTRTPNYAECSVSAPVPKEAPVRSESYRRFVASHPCFECGIEGYSQACHPNFGKGMSIKTSDLDCFPLCASHGLSMGCHAHHDLLIEMTREERREREARYIARMHELARAAGRPEFAKEAA